MTTLAARHALSHPLPFDLADAAFLADPGDQLASMREAGPLIPIRMPLVGKLWVTTTYAATEAVMKGKDRFAIEGRNAGQRGGAAGLAWWMPRNIRLLADNMLGKDDPDHRRLRKLVDQAFARRGVKEMRPAIEARADRLLDTLAGQDEVDLIARYTRRLPLAVIAELLGVPEAGRQKFERMGIGLTETGSALAILRMFRSIGKMRAYVGTMVEEARRTPRSGLIADLVAAEAEGDRLSETELVSMVFLLMFAGMETTTNLIAGSVVALERNPEQKAWLLTDPDARIERAVEELCRHVSAVTGTKPRYVIRDTEVEGQPLKRGERVMALPIAANHDPAVFDAPERLRLDRFPNPHLAFSSGVHFCLGMQLARVETQNGIQRLYTRFPALGLADPGRVVHAKRAGHRALLTLPVRPGPPSISE